MTREQYGETTELEGETTGERLVEAFVDLLVPMLVTALPIYFGWFVFVEWLRGYATWSPLEYQIVIGGGGFLLLYLPFSKTVDWWKGYRRSKS